MWKYSKGKLENIIRLKENIINHIEKDKLIKAWELLEEYENEFPYDIDIYSIKANLLSQEKKFDEAIIVAKEGLKIKPFNFDLKYNIAFIYDYVENYKDALSYAYDAEKVANNEMEETQIKDLINSLSIKMKNKGLFNKINNELEINRKKLDPRHFPLKNNNESYIGENIFSTDKYGYYTGYYKMPSENYSLSLWQHFKTEILKGEMIEGEARKIRIRERCVIPIFVKKSGQLVVITVNRNEYKLKSLIANRFYYIPFEGESIVRFKSKDVFFVGDVLYRNDENKIDSKKLVLNIFIDGLAATVIQNQKFEEYMPKTYKFFRNGIKFNNAHANGEWTLPSVPSFFTGNYCTKHNLFHPNLTYDIGRNKPLISDIFHENGYFTFQICGDWRKTPTYGYARGFDRTLYSQSHEGYKCEDIIFETIEQLKTFDKRKQFGWISLFELHQVHDNVNPSIFSQANNSINSLTRVLNTKKSVSSPYDEKLIERYITELKRLDQYLNILYQFIEDNYSEDEILISLVSDHGQSYLSDDNNILGEKRLNVPVIIKGGKNKGNTSDEFIENIDVFKILINESGIKDNGEKTDGKLPKVFGGLNERNYTYSESIYPGKIYKSVINDKNYRFYFDSVEKIENDGRFNVKAYKISLINKETGKDAIKEYEDKVSEYVNVVFDHIKSNIKI